MGHGTEWRVQLVAIGGASHHEWALGDGVVDGDHNPEAGRRVGAYPDPCCLDSRAELVRDCQLSSARLAVGAGA